MRKGLDLYQSTGSCFFCGREALKSPKIIIGEFVAKVSIRSCKISNKIIHKVVHYYMKCNYKAYIHQFIRHIYTIKKV